MASAALAGLALAVAVALTLQPGQSGDQSLSDAAKSERIVTFQAQGPLQVPEVSAGEQGQALDQMALAPADRQALQRDLAADKTSLAWLTLWDDVYEDGDVVEITGSGFKRTVALTKQPQRIAVPLRDNGRFLMRGVRDGGGGITVAATAASKTVPVPVLSPGQTIEIGLTTR